MKRLAFVSDAVYPFNKGGKEKRLYELTTRLVKRGYEVDVYTMKWWKDDSKTYVVEGVRYVAICRLYDLYDGEKRSIKEGVMFGLACFNVLKYDFDVVDVDHMPFFPLYSMRIVCWLKRKRMIATWHEVWGKEYWLEYLGWKGWLAWWIEWGSFWLGDGVVSVSKMTTKDLLRVSSNLDIVTIENGIDWKGIQSVEPSDLRSDVIFAGRLLSHKNVDLLMHAIGILHRKSQKILCRIVGEGPEKKRLMELVKTLNLEKNVVFHDFFDEHRELVSLIKASRVFVLPSSREGFGIVVLEANASGLGVVTVNEEKNAAKELVTSDTGVVVSLSPEDIAKGIVESWEFNKNACIAFSKRYSFEDQVLLYEGYAVQ